MGRQFSNIAGIMHFSNKNYAEVGKIGYTLTHYSTIPLFHHSRSLAKVQTSVVSINFNELHIFEDVSSCDGPC